MDLAGTSRGSIDGVRVAVAQVTPAIGDVRANAALAGRLLRRAAAKGADLLVLPECFAQGYSYRSDVLAAAERADGPAAQRLAKLAGRHHVALVAGLLETNPDDPARPFSAAIVADACGRLHGSYRKTHLYTTERGIFSRGDDYPVFELELGGDRGSLTVGVAICADIEYPEPIRILALRGARLIAVASADMEPFRAQQAANLASRAIENNVFVALANTVDARPDITFFGGSGIAGPAGSLVSAGYGRARLIVGALSEAEVDASGGWRSYLDQRRPEIYGDLSHLHSAP